MVTKPLLHHLNLQFHCLCFKLEEHNNKVPFSTPSQPRHRDLEPETIILPSISSLTFLLLLGVHWPTQLRKKLAIELSPVTLELTACRLLPPRVAASQTQTKLSHARSSSPLLRVQQSQLGLVSSWLKPAGYVCLPQLVGTQQRGSSTATLLSSSSQVYTAIVSGDLTIPSTSLQGCREWLQPSPLLLGLQQQTHSSLLLCFSSGRFPNKPRQGMLSPSFYFYIRIKLS